MFSLAKIRKKCETRAVDGFLFWFATGLASLMTDCFQIISMMATILLHCKQSV